MKILKSILENIDIDLNFLENIVIDIDSECRKYITIDKIFIDKDLVYQTPLISSGSYLPKVADKERALVMTLNGGRKGL